MKLKNTEDKESLLKNIKEKRQVQDFKDAHHEQQRISKIIQAFLKKIYEIENEITYDDIIIAWLLTSNVKNTKTKYQNYKNRARKRLSNININNNEIESIIPNDLENGNWGQGSYSFQLLLTETSRADPNPSAVLALIEMVTFLLFEENLFPKFEPLFQKFISCKPYSIQSGVLSPLLHCLNPRKFAVINDGIKIGLENYITHNITKGKITKLISYIDINERLVQFAKEYGFIDLSELDVYFYYLELKRHEKRPI